jgi:glycosyltransferase involved in cell wall biosynthesis
MISFIIIGKNEGWKLTQCFNSVFRAVEHCKILNYEVIYVDSKSTDDSIERARKFNNISIYLVKGDVSVAIARNIGAKESTGSILFFIDGDVEIAHDFLSYVLNESNSLIYEGAAGYLNHMFYNENWDFIKRVPQGYKSRLPSKSFKQPVVGGLYLIKKKYWELLKGFKTKYTKHEDHDFGLRLTKIGIYFTRVPHLMGLHHTIDYRNEKRMWNMLFSPDLKFSGMMVREHIFTLAMVKHTLRRQYTAILFMITILLLLTNFKLFYIAIHIYIVVFLIRVLMNTMKAATNRKNKLFYYFFRIGFQFISDLKFWYGFFTFYPKEKKMEYIKL